MKPLLVGTAIALAYFLTGKIGLLLAVPPGFATALWPPSGIGLAAVLVYGRKIAPAIAIASFALNTHGLPIDANIADFLHWMETPLVVGVGAVLQALVGRELVLRFARFPNNLTEPRQIGALLFWGGIVATIINPTVSVGFLHIKGTIPLDNVTGNWATWWAGDAMGVLLFTPMLLLVGHPTAKARRRNAAMLGGVILASFTTTAAFMIDTLRSERAEVADGFLDKLPHVTAALRRQIAGDKTAVMALAAMLDGRDRLDIGEMRNFAQIMRPGMADFVTLYWMSRNPVATQPGREPELVSDVVDLFEIGTATRLLDLWRLRVLRPALADALEKGHEAISPPFRLNGEEESSVLLIAPVFRGGTAPPDAAARKAACLGFAVGVLRLTSLTGAMLPHADWNDVDFWLMDETGPDQPYLLATNNSQPIGPLRYSESGVFGGTFALLAHGDIQAEGRRWTVYMRPTLGYLARHRSADYFFILFVCMAATGICSALVLVLMGRQDSLRRLVAASSAAYEGSEARFRTLVENATVGIFKADRDGHFVYANQEVSRLTGLAASAGTEAGWSVALHPDDRRPFWKSWTEAVAAKRPWTMEFRFRGQDAKLSWVRGTSVPHVDSSGEVIEFLGYLVDITVNKQSERMKSEFVSMVSHELRTPLTAIKGALGLVTSGVLGAIGEEVVPMLGIADSHCNHLIALINDLLDIEKIEAGKMEFHFAPLDLIALVRQSLAENAPLAKAHSVTFTPDFPRGPIWIYGDSMRLRQVMSNLLSNAAKFSHSGGAVEVTVSARGGKGQVMVTDHGVGIPDSFRGKIFQKFTQADSSDSRNRGGTGLGLAICRAIIDYHFGDIDFVSTPGAGSSFSFAIPLMEQSRPTPRRGTGEELRKNSVLDVKGP